MKDKISLLSNEDKNKLRDYLTQLNFPNDLLLWLFNEVNTFNDVVKD